MARSTVDSAVHSDETIPMAPGGLPLLGHTLRLRRDPLGFLDSLPAVGDLVRFRIGPKHVVMVCDPELAGQVLGDDRTFDKGGPLIELVKPLVSDGLATCPRSRHRRYRRLIQPVFDAARFPDYADRLTAATRSVTDGWRDGGAIDVPAEMRRISIHAAVRVLFSGVLAPSVVDRMADDFTTFLVTVAQRVGRPPIFDRLPSPDNRRHDKAIGRLRNTIQQVIDDRRSSRGTYDDLLTALLTTNAEGQQELADDVILGHAATFIAAPTATIASVMGWVLLMVASHPDIAARLHAEVDTVLAGAAADFGHVAELKFTRQIIMETIRMYPSVWIMTRVVTASTRLGGHVIPAGTVLTYSPYLVGRSALYDNPERFDPDRWDESRPAPPRHASIAFGGGARQCIAIQAAPLEMILALATIASRWRLEVVPGTPLRPRATVNLTARGLRMRTFLRANRDVGRPLADMADIARKNASAGTRRLTRRKPWLI
ncbi:Pentalenene oxygenase [Mycobacterium basiliense]|uniref:Pentalenene oxygenase n=1 Tax=Mycobacterium basiliense TaxID=2094119 RepID=A0A3S4DWH4_9MYCO|nr:cytochrome P450 [Mycobacterium basiliense]VDM90874.1 Pentalenene oxygenase [Mycobacterium basiliense]